MAKVCGLFLVFIQAWQVLILQRILTYKFNREQKILLSKGYNGAIMYFVYKTSPFKRIVITKVTFTAYENEQRKIFNKIKQAS